MLKSLDNSNGIQYYGGNDPAKMGGRIKKGGMAGQKGRGTGGLRSIDPNTPVSARIANATSSTGNKTPNRAANISAEASLRAASAARQGQQTARAIAARLQPARVNSR